MAIKISKNKNVQREIRKQPMNFSLLFISIFSFASVTYTFNQNARASEEHLSHIEWKEKKKLEPASIIEKNY